MTRRSWSLKPATATDVFSAVQCKFSRKPGRSLSVASAAEEPDKAARLASRDVADNYFTNMQLTGTVDEGIQAAFEATPVSSDTPPLIPMRSSFLGGRRLRRDAA
jgi:hypothetical protein